MTKRSPFPDLSETKRMREPSGERDFHQTLQSQDSPSWLKACIRRAGRSREVAECSSLYQLSPRQDNGRRQPNTVLQKKSLLPTNSAAIDPAHCLRKPPRNAASAALDAHTECQKSSTRSLKSRNTDLSLGPVTECRQYVVAFHGPASVRWEEVWQHQLDGLWRH